MKMKYEGKTVAKEKPRNQWRREVEKKEIKEANANRDKTREREKERERAQARERASKRERGERRQTR